MKKSIYYAVVLLIIFAVIFSCNKNEILEKNTYDSIQGPYKSSISKIDLSGVQLINGILHFDDSATMAYIIEALDELCEIYWDSILCSLPEMNDSVFEAYCDYNGLTEDQPLIDFENFFNFYSLRKKIAADELVWLEYEDPDCCIDPDDHFLSDETVRTLININGEVIIGEIIYKVYFSGTTLKIVNLDYQLLKDINTWDTIVLDTLRHPNFSYYYKSGQSTSDSCRNFKAKKDFFTYGDNRKIKAKLSISSMPWAGSVKAKTKNYKKKNSGWKVYSTSSSAHLEGKIYDGKCDFMTYIEKTESHNKKKIKCKVTFPNNSPHTKSGELSSEHYGAEGASGTLTLDTW